MIPPIPRRTLLQTLGAAGAAAALRTNEASASSRARGPLHFDFNRPNDSIEAITRVRGDVSGKRVYTYTRGRVYIVQPGQPATPFLGYESGLVDEYRQRRPSYYVWKAMNAPAAVTVQWNGGKDAPVSFTATVRPNSLASLPSSV